MNPHVEVEIARRYLVDGWQSFNKRPGDIWCTTVRQNQEKVAPHCWQTIPTRILAASPHLQGYDVPGDEIDKLKAQGLTLLEALEELGIA